MGLGLSVYHNKRLHRSEKVTPSSVSSQPPLSPHIHSLASFLVRASTRFKEDQCSSTCALTAPPAAIEEAKRYLAMFHKMTEVWKSRKPWIDWIPNDKIKELLGKAEELQQWLEGKQVENDKIPPTSTPVFTSFLVHSRRHVFWEEVRSLNRLQGKGKWTKKQPKELSAGSIPRKEIQKADGSEHDEL